MLVPKTHFAFFSFMLSLIKATFLDHPPECLLLLHSYADERAAGISEGQESLSPHGIWREKLVFVERGAPEGPTVFRNE